MVLKMVLMEVDHAMNVEGNREAAKLANWFTKRSVMTSSVTSLSTLLASFSTTLSINWSITIPNTTSPHLRCHKNSQAIWRSSVGLPGSPVVFMSQKSVFSETPCSSWTQEGVTLPNCLHFTLDTRCITLQIQQASNYDILLLWFL